MCISVCQTCGIMTETYGETLALLLLRKERHNACVHHVGGTVLVKNRMRMNLKLH